MEQNSEIELNYARFWVKVFEVSIVLQMISFAKFLADRIGTFDVCEKDRMFGVARSLSFGWNLLHRGMNVKVQGKPIRIYFTFIKLSAFCYGCGRRGIFSMLVRLLTRILLIVT